MTLDSLLQIDILGILILTMILFNYKKTTKSDIRGSLFLLLLLVTMFAQIFDILSNFANGRTEWYFYIINYVSVTSIYMSNLFPTTIWLLIVIYEVRKNKNELIKIIKRIIPVFVVLCLLIISSPFTSIMFKISKSNNYVRNSSFIFFTVLNITLTIVTLFYLNRDKLFLSKKQYLVLSLFAFPAVIGGAVQSVSGDYVTLWTGVSISCLILFMYIQTTLNDKDHITGLDTQCSLINNINELIADNTIFTLVIYELKDTNYTDIDKLRLFANSIKNVHPIGLIIARVNTCSFGVVTTSIDTQFVKKSFISLEQTLKENKLEIEYTTKSVLNNNQFSTYESIIESMK